MTTSASILAVGSERLAGLIVNGNAAWPFPAYAHGNDRLALATPYIVKLEVYLYKNE